MKRRQRRQLGLEPVDDALEPLDVGGGDCRLGHPRGDARRRVGEAGAEGEQVPLDRLEIGDKIRVREERPRGADAGVQLVDLAVGVDAGIGLRHPGLVEQRRLACIAGLCVDLHAWNYRGG